VGRGSAVFVPPITAAAGAVRPGSLRIRSRRAAKGLRIQIRAFSNATCLRAILRWRAWGWCGHWSGRSSVGAMHVAVAYLKLVTGEHDARLHTSAAECAWASSASSTRADSRKARNVCGIASVMTSQVAAVIACDYRVVGADFRMRSRCRDWRGGGSVSTMRMAIADLNHILDPEQRTAPGLWAGSCSSVNSAAYARNIF
jgi:hypothetical protein